MTTPARRAMGSLHAWGLLRSELLFIYDGPAPGGGERSRGRRDGELSAWLIRSGQARLRADGVEAVAVPGQWMICSAREVEQVLDPGTRLLSLRFHLNWADGSPPFDGGPVCVLDAGRHPRLELLARPLVRMASGVSMEGLQGDPRGRFLWDTEMDFPGYARYAGRLGTWMAALACAMAEEGSGLLVPGGRDPRLARAIQVLDSADLGGSFPDREIVRAGCLTLGRLNRICVQVYGCTLRSYWEGRRVRQARQALGCTGVRVKEVASALGFSSLPRFSAWFKRHAGASPRAYRARLAPGLASPKRQGGG